MRLLVVPNWSFGTGSDLLSEFQEVFDRSPVQVHFSLGDADHNRTVTAFSGDSESVLTVLRELCDVAFAGIDMREHSGVHPRIGALDVCPFISLDDGVEPFREALAAAERFAVELAKRHSIPVFLYEKSERGRHESDLPSLRKGGYEGLFNRDLKPDFGPKIPNLKLGATILGVREFLIALNINLSVAEPATAKMIARTLRDLRQEGDVRFLGVRALGFPLASRGMSQVSLNLTLPDITPIDPIVEWVVSEAAMRAVEVLDTELIGVIRRRHIAGATHLMFSEDQIVD